VEKVLEAPWRRLSRRALSRGGRYQPQQWRSRDGSNDVTASQDHRKPLLGRHWDAGLGHIRPPAAPRGRYEAG